MPLKEAENGTAEIARGDHYPHIRLFTVSPTNCSTVPFEDLQPASLQMNWSVGSAAALNQSFSGVCWLFGRDLYLLRQTFFLTVSPFRSIRLICRTGTISWAARFRSA